MEPQPPTPHTHSWLYRRVALPIFALLRVGASPERLAWSVAIGAVVGVNPLLGSTTVLCLLLAFVFRLNVAASQLANHLAYPLQLILLVPFLGLGTRVFRTAAMPIAPTDLLRLARTHPVALSRQLWIWESHALIVWAALSVLVAPALAMSLTPILRRLQRRVLTHQYPILPDAS